MWIKSGVTGVGSLPPMATCWALAAAWGSLKGLTRSREQLNKRIVVGST